MAGAVRRFGSMGGFTKHRTGGSGGDYLAKWKDKGSIEVWFHIKELPLAMWRHQIPMIVITGKEKKSNAWTKNLVCHEDETVLESQYFRDRDTAERKHPPKRCGVCKLVEWAYQQCLKFEDWRAANAEQIEKGGKPIPEEGIRFTTPIFRFEDDDPKETKIFHIGGLCNLFNKDLNDAQKKDMAEAKISPKFAWKENMWAKCQYAMCVVNNDRPDDGVQLAVEASSLGDKVKEVLDDMVESDKREYEKNPYCVKWKYNEAETDLNKKYKALPMRDVALTPRIAKLIRGEAPTQAIEKLIERFSQQTVRASLEAHCLLPKGTVPWDELFPTVEQQKAWDEEDATAEAEAEESAREHGGDNDDVSGGTSEASDDGDEEMFACDNCEKPIKASDAKCPHCGHVYVVTAADDADENDAQEPEPEPEPAKPPLRKRGEATAEKAAAASKPAPKKTAAASGKKGAPSAADDQDSEVPF